MRNIVDQISAVGLVIFDIDDKHVWGRSKVVSPPETFSSPIKKKLPRPHPLPGSI